MIDTCTVYYLFVDELEKIPMIPKTTPPIIPKKPVVPPMNTPVSACEIYMCALIIQVILVTAF